MGTFAGHVVPGVILILNSIIYVIRTTGDTFMSNNFNYLMMVMELILLFCLPLVGIILEHVAYWDSPHGHLCSPDGSFRDPHNWQHSTMYFFFLIFGVFRNLNYIRKDSIVKGKNT